MKSKPGSFQKRIAILAVIIAGIVLLMGLLLWVPSRPDQRGKQAREFSAASPPVASPPSPGLSQIDIYAWINPSGSTNLEYDSMKEATMEG